MTLLNLRGDRNMSRQASGGEGLSFEWEEPMVKSKRGKAAQKGDVLKGQ